MFKKDKIKQIVDKYDPIGLLAGGAPEDEYTSEISDILIILDNQFQKDQSAVKIIELFEKSFGEDVINYRSIKLMIDEIISIKE